MTAAAAPPEQPALEERVIAVLRAAYQHCAATDAANGAANLADPRERPLTRELRAVHDELWAVLTGEDQPLPEDDQPSR